jgi:F0F1-type ATP synthase assembly protein I
LLPGAQASLLLTLGPGLILGGALSFAVFQIVGRGVVGVIATLVFGLAAAVLLVRKFEPEPDAEPRWWMLGQLVGMGMLAITPEFTELLPVAIVTLVLGYLADPAHRRPRVLLPSLIFGVSAALLFWTWRQKYWWLINDDHLLFEVLAQHIFREGPFADWGVTSFAKYHWL